MTDPTGGPEGAGPLPMRGRSIAPDLARGAMLLLIAVANVWWFIWYSEDGRQEVVANTADWIAWVISVIAVDARVYPMFAFLFGYGLVQMYQRQTAAGVPPEQGWRLLRRRQWWLIAFGFVQAALLWSGDILGTYGLAGLLLVRFFFYRSDRILRLWVFGLTVLAVVAVIRASVLGWAEGPTDLMPIPVPEAIESMDSVGEADAAAAAGMRILQWLIYTPYSLLGPVTIAMLAGMAVARHRVLERPAEHRQLLTQTAVLGLAIGWGTGLAIAFSGAGVWGGEPALYTAISYVGYVGGLFGGIGYVALFGLIAIRLESRRARGDAPGRVSSAVQALGKRSLSGYLAQSLVFAPTLSAWGLGWGSTLTAWSLALFAVAVWLVTVALAMILERDGQRGPAEWLLRRLVYPRPEPETSREI